MCHRRNWHSLRPPGGPMPSGAIFVFLWLAAATAAPPPLPSPSSLFSVPSGNNENDSKIAEGNARVQWHNPWGDELQPYRLKSKQLHDRGLTKRDKQNDGTHRAKNGTHRAKNGTSAELSADWRWPSAEQAVQLEKITAIGPNAELNFHANQTQLHVRTETWMMRFGQCMKVRFRVEGKRTRLLMYTCHMAEGGTCVLDKFLATTTLKQLDRANPFKLDSCHMLKPWLFPPSPFAFHFRFVRRPRKFADKAKALRHRRRRHGRHATREVGRVELHGFRDCEKACVTDGGGELEDIPLAGANYFEDPLQGWKRRKR
ncbi:hypothetical protein GPALN_004105 [Globodera pallida]|nr:hypothetical protein GPALN_004105 [Globodera pallida]